MLLRSPERTRLLSAGEHRIAPGQEGASPSREWQGERMPSIDMPLEKLREYQPPLYREPDFEEFWRSTLADAMKQPLNAELIPFDLPARGVQCYAVRFDGLGGGRIAGWYLRPDASRSEEHTSELQSL